MRGLLLLYVALGGTLLNAQIIERDLVVPDGRVLIKYQMKDLPENKSLYIDREYYWFDLAAIQKTFGGIHGHPLHGKFVKFGTAGELLEQGQFVEGLKDGVWKGWDSNGHLHYQEQWKSGRLVGVRMVYNSEGQMIAEEQFKDGKLHGKCRYLTDGVFQEKKYKEGKELVKKKRAPEVSDIEPMKEVPEDVQPEK